MFEAEDIWFLARLQVHVYELQPDKTTVLLEPLWLLEAVNLVLARESSSSRNLLDSRTNLTNLLTSKRASMVTHCVEGIFWFDFYEDRPALWQNFWNSFPRAREDGVGLKSNLWHTEIFVKSHEDNTDNSEPHVPTLHERQQD